MIKILCWEGNSPIMSNKSFIDWSLEGYPKMSNLKSHPSNAVKYVCQISEYLSSV